MSGEQMHYIWDYERNTGICWCGEDHADDSGNHGPIPEDQWIPADDSRVAALLDDMYAEAWLGHLPLDAKLTTGEWRWVPEERKPGAAGWWRRCPDGTTEALRWFPYYDNQKRAQL